MNHSETKYLLAKNSVFFKKHISVKNLRISYYVSTLLSQNNIIHAFFTKESSEVDLDTLGYKLTNINCSNIFLKQIHSNKVLYCKNLKAEKLSKADGLISTCIKQNLCIYTADCMPILIADKGKNRVAAIHCGREGLGNNIIPNLINKMELMGSLRKDLLVAIGPSISGKNYLLDKKTYERFHKNFKLEKSLLNFLKNDIKKSNKIIYKEMIPLDIKKYAFYQLINESIDPNNIDIFSKCTFDVDDEFHSWRRSRKENRQWSIISI